MADPEESAPAPSAPRRRRATLWGTLRRFGRLWGFLAFLVLVVLLFRAIILPFIFGFLVAYLLAPVVRRLQPRLGRPGAVVAVYAVILGVLVLFFGLLLPAVTRDLVRVRDAAPTIAATVERDWLPRVSAVIEENFGDLTPRADTDAPADQRVVAQPRSDGSWEVDLSRSAWTAEEVGEGRWVFRPLDASEEADLPSRLRHMAAAKGAQLGAALGPLVQGIVFGVVGFFTKLVLTFMIAGFLLVDLDRVNRFVRSLVPLEYRHHFDELLSGMDQGLAGVLRGQLVICLVNGALTWVGLVLFDIKYSLLLAVFAAVLSLIPIFGTIVSSIPIVLIALVSDASGFSLGPALAMLAWIAGIHLLEANVLNPKIIGDSAHMHPVVVVFALLAGEHTFGLVGALLAVPVASMVQTAFLFARRRSGVLERAGEGSG